MRLLRAGLGFARLGPLGGLGAGASPSHTALSYRAGRACPCRVRHPAVPGAWRPGSGP